MEIINFASLNDEKGRYSCNAKGTFFAVTATQKEGFNTPFRTEKRPNGSSRKQVLLKERTIYKSDKCHE
ncbi:hypothetical protein [Prevotella aurantiaca]|uniref:hypothetical protein n=1 Tax=Prevotella aurantiaca TaxID=596085 RepID=UPI0023568442|nr:hypothetical protein [Prevotella aurantiaca]